MGDLLGHGFFDYQTLVDDDDRAKVLAREQIKIKKKKMRAKDIANAINRQDTSQSRMNQSDTDKIASDSDIVSTNSGAP